MTKSRAKVVHFADGNSWGLCHQANALQLTLTTRRERVTCKHCLTLLEGLDRLRRTQYPYYNQQHQQAKQDYLYSRMIMYD